MNIDEIFGASGALSRVIPGYSPREGQVEFASAIAQAIAEKSALLGEAPTGVGKSAAALAPVIVAKKKALYVTANISLSEQIVYKDFPLIARALALGSDATVALAKGINNYACLESVDDQKKNATGELEKVCDWAALSETGDFSELSFTPSPTTLRLVSRGSEECLRKACSNFDDCFGLKARRLAKDADVVVTNYHLLFAHLEILMSGAAGGILPDVDVLILDEAHKMADIARGFVGNRVTEYGIRRAAAALAPSQASRFAREALDVALHREIDREARAVFARATRLRAGRIKKPGQLEAVRAVDVLNQGAAVYGDAIRAAVDAHVPDSFIFAPAPPKELFGWYSRMKKGDDRAKSSAGYVEKLRISGRSLRKASWALKAADELMDAGEVVHYTERPERGTTCAVCSSPIEVGPYLRERIWETSKEKDGGKIFPTVVAMSATLRDGGDSFELVRRELGAPEKVVSLAVKSPFDFSRCMLFCRSDWPEPSDPGFSRHLADSLEETITAAGGRTLALFASWRALNETADEIRRRLGRHYTILHQKDAPRSLLVKWFKEDETSVLMGVESFWAGVDVPGRSLSALWIEKLPFSSPEDPVFDALNERLGRDAFRKYSLPRAVIQLRQGFGRLIRGLGDAGVVVVADPRLFTANYSSKFTSVLPEGLLAAETWDDVRSHLQEYLR